MTLQNNPLKRARFCLREPIPEIAVAARYLDEAVSAHIIGNTELAGQLIQRADMPEIRAWVESLWGSKSPYTHRRAVQGAPPTIPKDRLDPQRHPTPEQKKQLLQRDGYNCQFCGIPVIRVEIRKRLKELYPHALMWGGKNREQHPTFQAMWVQYDHILPHARGGTSDMENLIITCAPCNYGRMDYTLEEVGLADPRTREPVRSSWDGLERLLVAEKSKSK